MRVLVVKTSSMGDLVHTLPALTDAQRSIAGIRFDWVAEEAFAEIPTWHPAVDRVIAIALRRWRRAPLRAVSWREAAQAVAALRGRRYDWIIDAQGLIKSAAVTRLARGRRCGLDMRSCREPIAALGYQRRFAVPKQRHAIDRVRALFAGVLGYSIMEGEIDYGIASEPFEPPPLRRPYLVFLHASSRSIKLWPEADWVALARRAGREGFAVVLPWGDPVERQRARSIASAAGGAVEVLPRMRLRGLAAVLRHASGAVGVDTGLAHLAAALRTPAVTLFLATDPERTGTRGYAQSCMKPAKISSESAPKPGEARVNPCVDGGTGLSPDTVWNVLVSNMVTARAPMGSLFRKTP